MPGIAVTPSLLFSEQSRIAVRQVQSDLQKAQQESTTGRHADVSLTLGANVGADIRLRLELSTISHGRDAASLAGATAAASQSALASINDLASKMLSMLTAMGTAQDGQALAADAGRSAFETLRSLVNTSYGDQFIFGGQNTIEAPLKPFDAGPEGAISAAFEAAFGFPASDPAAVGIAPASMTSFMDGALDAVFAPAEWSAHFSKASTGNVRARLDDGVAVDVTPNANANFVPQLAKAFSMLFALGEGQLSQSSFQSVVNGAMATIADAQRGIGGEQASLGMSQSRITSHIEILDARSSVATSALRKMEEVDPYEAATRVNTLMNQLASSYAITARLSRLSLLNYL